MQVADKLAQREVMKHGANPWGKSLHRIWRTYGLYIFIEGVSPRARVENTVLLNHTIRVEWIIFKNQNEKEKRKMEAGQPVMWEHVYNEGIGPVTTMHSMATYIPLNHNLRAMLH